MTTVQKNNNQFSTKAKKELKNGQEISQGGLVYRKLADGTGTWRYDFVEAGKRHKGVIGAEKKGVTLSQARHTLQAIRAKATTDRISGRIGRSTQASRKFSDAARDYLYWSQEHHQDKGHNKGRMKKYLLPRFGHMKLEDITASKIEEMRTDLYQADLKRSTVQRIVSLLSGVFEHARKSDSQLENPTRSLSHMKSQMKEVEVFSQLETEAMLETGCLMYNTVTRGSNKGQKTLDQRQTIEARAMVGLALLGGLRASEVLGLAWQDIDLSQRLIHIHQTAHEGELRQSTKNYETRTVPFQNKLKSLLAVLKEQQESANRAGDLLFSQDGVKPYFQVQQIFRRIKAQSGMEIVGGFHTFRHTYATRLANKNAPLPHLQKLLGHSDIKVTMGYIHTSEEDIMRTVELMD